VWRTSGRPHPERVVVVQLACPPADHVNSSAVGIGQHAAHQTVAQIEQTRAGPYDLENQKWFDRDAAESPPLYCSAFSLMAARPRLLMII